MGWACSIPVHDSGRLGRQPPRSPRMPDRRGRSPARHDAARAARRHERRAFVGTKVLGTRVLLEEAAPASVGASLLNLRRRSVDHRGRPPVPSERPRSHQDGRRTPVRRPRRSRLPVAGSGRYLSAAGPAGPMRVVQWADPASATPRRTRRCPCCAWWRRRTGSVAGRRGGAPTAMGRAANPPGSPIPAPPAPAHQ